LFEIDQFSTVVSVDRDPEEEFCVFFVHVADALANATNCAMCSFSNARIDVLKARIFASCGAKVARGGAIRVSVSVKLVDPEAVD